MVALLKIVQSTCVWLFLRARCRVGAARGASARAVRADPNILWHAPAHAHSRPATARLHTVARPGLHAVCVGRARQLATQPRTTKSVDEERGGWIKKAERGGATAAGQARQAAAGNCASGRGVGVYVVMPAALRRCVWAHSNGMAVRAHSSSQPASQAGGHAFVCVCREGAEVKARVFRAPRRRAPVAARAGGGGTRIRDAAPHVT